MLYEKIKSDGHSGIDFGQMLTFGKGTFENEYHKRQDYIKKYGFSVPTKEAVSIIAEIADKKQILEVGAGLGLWSCFLSQEGANTICTDEGNPAYAFKNSPPWHDVESLSASDAVLKYTHAKVLLCSWPCYGKNWFTQACNLFKGTHIIHIGEYHGGCTADDSFFEMMDNWWNEPDVIRIPQWLGIHDSVQIYTRKTLK